MNKDSRLGRNSGTARLVAISALSLAVPGCLDRPIDTLEPRTTSTVVEPLAQSRVERIDLLLAIDNSGSMADKQSVLAKAVPDLVGRLITPKCIDDLSGLATGASADAEGRCPAGSEPEFAPVTDVHIGVITSSLGDLGTGACDDEEHANDGARLIDRTKKADGATLRGKEFLAWDPTTTEGASATGALRDELADMVRGADQLGCRFEMQLESVYRFLADPAPYASLSKGADGKLVEVGLDEELLRQRRDFLRPDSLVAVVMLSDENDCSVDITQPYFQDVIAKTPFWKATDECAENPNDVCCTSCAAKNPAGCAPDLETCGPGQGTLDANRYAHAEDSLGWRCSDQKRRYGLNLLYPTTRYVNALTKPRIDTTRSDLATEGAGGEWNPLFVTERDGVRIERPAGFVYMSGIVGVPWQAIAKKDASGNPSLALGFQSVEELTESGAMAKLAGNPDANVPPTDPFMIETSERRTGTSDLLGVSPAAENAINGGDRTFEVSDLQYACTFGIETPEGHDCATCTTAECDDPLCNGTEQIAAKAYPGTRELAVLGGLGEQGIPASICPEQVTDETQENFGYAPAVRTIVDKLKKNLRGQCLPRQLEPAADGSVSCIVIEARVAAGGACSCDPATGRADIPATLDGDANPMMNAVKMAELSEFNPGWDCFCEVEQLQGDARAACQTDAKPEDVHGWCYVDATTVPQIGNPDLVKDCAADERRMLRFAGDADPISGATAFITCTGE